MDELEISGKRYISTRRAGKDYKYHSDYIGQLVRAKKVVGQKVGRSWYVNEESLAAYLKNPQASAPAAVAAEPAAYAVKAAPIQDEVASEVVQEIVEDAKVEASTLPVEIKKDEATTSLHNAVKEVDVEMQKPAVENVHIPIRRASFAEPVKKNNSLTYIEEDAPTFPEITRTHTASRATASPFIKNITQEETVEEEVPTEKRGARRAGALAPALGVVFAGVVVFVAVAAGSTLVSSKIVVEAGKAAIVEYSFR